MVCSLPVSETTPTQQSSTSFSNHTFSSLISNDKKHRKTSVTTFAPLNTSQRSFFKNSAIVKNKPSAHTVFECSSRLGRSSGPQVKNRRPACELSFSSTFTGDTSNIRSTDRHYLIGSSQDFTTAISSSNDSLLPPAFLNQVPKSQFYTPDNNFNLAPQTKNNQINKPSKQLPAEIPLLVSPNPQKIPSLSPLKAGAQTELSQTPESESPAIAKKRKHTELLAFPECSKTKFFKLSSPVREDAPSSSSVTPNRAQSRDFLSQSDLRSNNPFVPMIPAAAATLAFQPLLSFHHAPATMTGTIGSPITDLESYYLGAPAITAAAAGLNCASESGCESESPQPKTAAEKEIAEAQVKFTS